jgi:hypothetical protein
VYPGCLIHPRLLGMLEANQKEKNSFRAAGKTPKQQ